MTYRDSLFGEFKDEKSMIDYLRVMYPDRSLLRRIAVQLLASIYPTREQIRFIEACGLIREYEARR